jgi:hypothetical protein
MSTSLKSASRISSWQAIVRNARDLVHLHRRGPAVERNPAVGLVDHGEEERAGRKGSRRPRAEAVERGDLLGRQRQNSPNVTRRAKRPRRRQVRCDPPISVVKATPSRWSIFSR